MAINGAHFQELGFVGREIGIALQVEYNLPFFEGILDDSASYLGAKNELVNELAILIDRRLNAPKLRDKAINFPIWGEDLIAANAIDQMADAMRLPVTRAGALMPDAHLGYGVPIGAVVALKDAISPYMVGLDIACRMKMTIIRGRAPDSDVVVEAIDRSTRFGVNSGFDGDQEHEHEILDDPRWRSTDLSCALFDNGTIRRQLGSSGGGNHFVDAGTLRFTGKNFLSPFGADHLIPTWAIMSHSGSRGFGAKTASLYHKLAKKLTPFNELAYLEFGKMGEAEEYWEQMNLAGDYASANHDCIHSRILTELDIDILDTVQFENHHNFAWKEYHDIWSDDNSYDVSFSEEVYVHRKGATPAGKGEIGIIPSSMGTTSYLVAGKGNPKSLSSASHGAGRVMSRTVGHKTFDWDTEKLVLEGRGITILGGDSDEVPGVYKDLKKVLAAQSDLVEIIAQFQPRIVKMA